MNNNKLNGKEYKLIINDYFTHVEVTDEKGNKSIISFAEFKEILDNINKKKMFR